MEVRDDVELIRAAAPALLRVVRMAERLAYLEERDRFAAAVGRVWQDAVSVWAGELHRDDNWKTWKKPEPDPHLATRLDRLWRLTELLQEAYPDAVKAVDTPAP